MDKISIDELYGRDSDGNPKIPEEELMKNTPLYPKTKKELAFDKKVEHWRHKLSNILVAPFNKNTWSNMSIL